MKKKQYVQPEVAVNQLETVQMMATSGLSRFESPADANLDVLVNQNDFTDIWGN